MEYPAIAATVQGLHRHREEDEMFFVLSGAAEFRCGDDVLTAHPGDFALLPAGLPHTFVVGSDEPLAGTG